MLCGAVGSLFTKDVATPVSSLFKFNPFMPKAFLIQPFSFSTKSLIVKIPLNFMCSLFLRPIPLTSSIGISPTISKILSGGITNIVALGFIACQFCERFGSSQADGNGNTDLVPYSLPDIFDNVGIC